MSRRALALASLPLLLTAVVATAGSASGQTSPGSGSTPDGAATGTAATGTATAGPGAPTAGPEAPAAPPGAADGRGAVGAAPPASPVPATPRFTG